MLPAETDTGVKNRDWKTGYPKVRTQVFNGPAITAKPLSILPARETGADIGSEKNASGNPEWARIDIPSPEGGASWVEARHMAGGLDEFITKRFEGVDLRSDPQTERIPREPPGFSKGNLCNWVNTASSDNLDALIRAGG